MKIYTKTGDKGETSLFGGRRMLKSNLQIEAYGEIDELNSFLGLVLCEISQVDIKRFIKAIQTDLFTIGSFLSGNLHQKLNLEVRVSEIEKIIDELDNKLPHIHNFILPGGGRLGATLHVCRSISRRAERSVIRFFQDKESNPLIIMYLNRLSDFLYMLARFANHEEKREEEIWKDN